MLSLPVTQGDVEVADSDLARTVNMTQVGQSTTSDDQSWHAKPELANRPANANQATSRFTCPERTLDYLSSNWPPLRGCVPSPSAQCHQLLSPDQLASGTGYQGNNFSHLFI